MVDTGTTSAATNTATNTGRLPGFPPEWSPTGPPQPNEPPAPDIPVPPPPHSLPMIVTPILDPADPQSRLLRQRIVLLTGPLDQAAADTTTAQLLLLDSESQRPVQLRMSCPDADIGADIGAAQSLIATIDLIGAPVHAIAVGPVCGAAVAVYATAVRREAHPHATFVLREPTTRIAGDAEHLATEAEQHRRQLASIVGRIAATTGRTADSVAADMRTGRFLTADQALGYGLVQAIVS